MILIGWLVLFEIAFVGTAYALHVMSGRGSRGFVELAAVGLLAAIIATQLGVWYSVGLPVAVGAGVALFGAPGMWRRDPPRRSAATSSHDQTFANPKEHR